MRIPLLQDDLAPAGHPLLWQCGNESLPALPGFVAVGLQSGTAALAAAILLARLQRPEVATPQVILPGYGCPDLVAAARFAGVEPLLVDIEADDPGYSHDALRRALSARVVAVVAVNFLGISERLSALRALLRDADAEAVLIEDDAQWFPEAQASQPHGDLVCTSFGRGKPVSLLGGGVLWVDARHAAAIEQLPISAALPERALRFKAALFNALLRPRLYGLVNRNPLISLGQTRFKPLTELRALDACRHQLLPANIDRHVSRSREPERDTARMLSEFSEVLDLATAVGERCGRLLRYPLLCRDVSQRDRLRQALHDDGLGATAMYRCALPDVEGVGVLGAADPLPGAHRFAERLLTLPVHAGVTERHRERIALAIRRAR